MRVQLSIPHPTAVGGSRCVPLSLCVSVWSERDVRSPISLDQSPITRSPISLRNLALALGSCLWQGRALGRIDAIQIEMTANKCALPYHGAPNCNETITQMAELGLATNGRCDEPRHFSSGSWGCNGDFVFWASPQSPPATEAQHGFDRRAPDIRGAAREAACCSRPLFQSPTRFASRPSDCAFLCRRTSGCRLFSHSYRRFDCILCREPPAGCRLSPFGAPSTRAQNTPQQDAPTTWLALGRNA